MPVQPKIGNSEKPPKERVLLVREHELAKAQNRLVAAIHSLSAHFQFLIPKND